jgi:hypothetical protein
MEMHLRLDLDKEILAYLRKYGNTKQKDLIEYVVHTLNQSPKNGKKILEKMLVEGWVKQIIHDKLGENVVYFARGNWTTDLALEIEAEALGIKDKKEAVNEARRILDEAAKIAEKRVKKKTESKKEDASKCLKTLTSQKKL